ncbi:MAG: patatin-like phospholipase family protein [Bacteroidales bacterium]|nr:patatin-like phospholipase family protein [Bacteroidales bacterium]
MKKILIILALILASAAAGAQERSTATFGLDPSDSLAVAGFRSRMDSIRLRRPTVALVLSGGGAKGAAHIGALEFIQQYDIPVDLVVGTSIGGLIGGFYSLGYTPSYLDSMMRSINWDIALSDEVSREYLPFRRIRHRDRYILSFPFDFGGKKKDIHFANTSNQSTLASKSVSTGLPSGLVYGQNVGYIISSLTPGYADSTDFLEFPIPFVCVATDMVSGKAKVWHSGSINTALRSTMSIPALFTPVRTGDMILTDGGMRNNFPVEIAKEMGADIVIGVDLSDARMGYDDIRNLADIIWRSIDLLSEDSFERNLHEVDLYVKPDLHEYNMMSFDSESVDIMIGRGYSAAREKSMEFAKLKGRIGLESFSIGREPAKDVNRNYLLIDTVIINGVSPKEADIMRSKMYIKGGKVVNRYELEKAVNTIFGAGGYDFVNYEILGEKEPHSLVLNCQKGPKNQLGVGFRIDTEELVAVLLNLGFNTNSMQGAALDLNAKIGSNPWFNAHFTYDVPKIPTINLEASVKWTDRNSFIMGDNRYNISYLMTDQRLYLSNIRWNLYDVQGGIANNYYSIRRLLTDNLIGDYDQSIRAWDYPSVFLYANADTRDNSYFPTKGFNAGLKADLFARFGDATSSSSSGQPLFATFSGNASLAVPVFNFLTLIPFGDFRFIVGDDIPVPFANALGGYMRGRYVSHQIPFAGIDNAAFRRNYLVSVGADLRFNIAPSHYITARGNIAYDFNDFSRFEDGEAVKGLALGYTYNSIIGPISAFAHWSSLTNSPGAYLSIGLDF